jgi:hypothetical protein
VAPLALSERVMLLQTQGGVGGGGADQRQGEESHSGDRRAAVPEPSDHFVRAAEGGDGHGSDQVKTGDIG